MRFLKLARTTAGGFIALLLLAASVPAIAAAPVEAGFVAQAGNVPATVTQGGAYTNTWAVKVAPGVDINAIAARLGLQVVRQIGSLEGYYLLAAPAISGRADNITAALRGESGILYAEQQVTLARTTREPTDDPLYANQWHLNNTGQGGGLAGADAKVPGAWTAGFTGEGVVVASVDDGVWVAHPDLAPNIRADLSYDFINDDPDPSGGGHGTAVAGVMAAADNPQPNVSDYCGVGAAYDAEIAGLLILDFGMTDAVEASALSYRPDDIHVYNNSWGPFDDGFTLEGPGPLAKAALQNGAFHGRNGLGSIYTWAAGNGSTSDNINADGYANSIYVIAVGASANTGVRAGYSEPGSAMLVNAPSGGGTLGITTTAGSTSGCTGNFGGTSSAAPLAAGVIALILEANPGLTYRDVQHILVETSDVIDATNPDWQTNGAGKLFSHYYGFGRVNATAAVAAAQTWVNVPAQTFYSSAVESVGAAIPEDAGAPVTDTITVTEDIDVEHVQVVFDADHPSRGQVHVDLVSPDGTVSNLIFGRPDSGDNYDNWTLMTVANWGESSVGDWTIRVYDRTSDANDGTFNSWQLVIWGSGGTQQVPTPTELPQTPAPTSTPEGTAVATETPDATATVDQTPTVDVTATVDLTPTATSTEVPGAELLDNGGFEAKDANNDPDLTPWTVKNGTGDKIKCNKDKDGDGTADKIVSHTGECAFRFKGFPGDNSKLVQAADLTGVTLIPGDALNLSVWVDAPGTPDGKIKLRVKYSDATEKGKLNIDLAATSGYTELTGQLLLASSAVENIKLTIGSKAASGKVYVDDASLILAAGGVPTGTPESTTTPDSTPSLLPLP
jgi:subtilisin-like proprotein convertase family protein